MCNISIEGRAGICKKLNKSLFISQLRESLKKYISEEHFFINKDGYEITRDDENEFLIEEILFEGNYIKIKKDLPNIIIVLEDKKLIEMKIHDENISLYETRKLSEKILDIYFFVNKEDNEIPKDNEKKISVKTIIHNGIIKMKKSFNNNDYENNEIEKENDKKIIHEKVEKKENEIQENLKEEDKEEEIKNLIEEEEKKVKEKILIEERNENDENEGNIIIEEDKEKIYETKKGDEENIIENNNKLEDTLIKINKLFELYKFDSDNKEGTILYTFNEKYGQYKGLKRFAIPVFGIISSGKSTFLNYILNLNNILEMDEQITTKFVCIIRNKKGLKYPKIYEVKIILRDENSVNFEKGEEKKENIKEYIYKKK